MECDCRVDGNRVSNICDFHSKMVEQIGTEGIKRAFVAERARITQLEAALRSVVTQCDNVIHALETGTIDDARNGDAWRSVRDYAKARS